MAAGLPQSVPSCWARSLSWELAVAFRMSKSGLVSRLGRGGVGLLAFEEAVNGGQSEGIIFLSDCGKELNGQVEFGGLLGITNSAHGFAREDSAERHGGGAIFSEPMQATFGINSEGRLT